MTIDRHWLAYAAVALITFALGWWAARRRAAGHASGSTDPTGAELAALLDAMRATLDRTEAHQSQQTQQVQAQLERLASTQHEVLRQGTVLQGALRNPGVRGRWGEVQLTRLAQSAGLVEGVSFRLQPGFSGGRQRPDMVVDLGPGRRLVVDAKAPLDALLDNPDGSPPTPEQVRRHATALRARIAELSSRSYTDLPQTPDFVVLFLPAEGLLSLALEADADLLQVAADANVILATPTTLLALLRLVAEGWRQTRAQEDAEELLALASEAVERVGMVAQHLQLLGNRLQSTVTAYNQVAGSWQTRLRPTQRRLAAYGQPWDGVADLSELDATTRTVTAWDEAG